MHGERREGRRDQLNQEFDAVHAERRMRGRAEWVDLNR